MHNRWKIAILMLTVISLISGCFGKKEVLEPLQPSKIKVLYQDEDAFYRDYGKYFNMKYPQIEVEVIPQVQVLKNLGKMISAEAWEAEVKKLLENSEADVYMLNDTTFKQFATDGRLYGLDEVISQDGYDIEGYMPGLIDTIKSLGDGKLYGLAPYVRMKALYYNTKLFAENQIDPPTNKMTWQEVFNLAARFSTVKNGGRPVHGFYHTYGNIGELMYDIADTAGLKLIDPTGEKVFFNSDGWKQAMRLATDAVRNNAVYFRPESQLYSSQNDFYDGVAAMTISGPPTSWGYKYQETVDWEIVTVPIEPGEESTGVYFDELFAVSANSQNKRAAWEFVKFASGPEMAHARSRTMDGKLPTRTGYLKEFKGKSMEAFYMLKAKEGNNMWGNVSRFEFYRVFNKTLMEELQAVIDNKKSVDEAAAELEFKAQDALVQLREKSKKKPTGSS
ncbi:extracellular solute-binding protein [Paenibacillus alvei]|uniref:ABC transporter substrate-binding protein n=1 Tax=Paenibacillus TaxID=44249 RepID=UPI003D2DBB2B